MSSLLPRKIGSDSALVTLINALVSGNRLALARTLRLIDDTPSLCQKIGVLLHSHRKNARVIGITGNPGAGKSTLVDGMIALYRAQGKKVAVLAIDPSSPFSGGAILGDRIRMSSHSSDDGVFIHSFATRGALGGLSRSTFDAVTLLDAAGYDVILIETVGVGQDEIDVARLAQTTLVILVPGLGDDVQAIKAGLLEIADIFIINKADREGAPQVERGLHQLLSLAAKTPDWEPPILRTVALRKEGVEEVIEKIALHQNFLAGADGAEKRGARALYLFDRLLDATLVAHGRKKLTLPLAALYQKMSKQECDPYVEVETILEQWDN